MRRWRSMVAVSFLSLALGLVAEGAPERRPVPEAVGLRETDASALLAAAGYSVEVKDVAGEPQGTVARQSPGGFAWADSGVRVTIEVRRGAGWKPVVAGATPKPVAPTDPDRPPNPSAEVRPVPNVVGKLEAEALDLLRFWRVQLATTAGSAANEGRVTDQDPAAGTPLADGGSVSVTVARADTPSSTTATVPLVVGLDEDAASRRIVAAGLVPLVDRVRSDPENAGKVVGQDPAAGTVIAKNSNVAVMVGLRKPSVLLEVEVPDLVKFTEADARARAEQVGFVVVVKDKLAQPAAVGSVLEQDPVAGSRLSTGRKLTLVVGRLLLLPLFVPDVSGLEAGAAETALRSAGFDVAVATVNTLPGSAGKVVLQEPAGGATLNRGALVKISIGKPESPLPETVPVPALVGRTEEQARADLAAVGLVARTSSVPQATGEAAGRVRGQAPTAGTPVARGSEVVIEIASARPSSVGIVLPSYLGQEASMAQADLAARGLRVGLVLVTALPDGRVQAQSPPAGTTVSGGSLITLTVSRAPTLGVVILVDPPHMKSVPKNFGVTFQWNPVPEAEDYEFETLVDKDGVWVNNSNFNVRETMTRPNRVKKGTYQWHVRARKAGGTIVGPWSEWRRLTIY